MSMEFSRMSYKWLFQGQVIMTYSIKHTTIGDDTIRSVSLSVCLAIYLHCKFVEQYIRLLLFDKHCNSLA